MGSMGSRGTLLINGLLALCLVACTPSAKLPDLQAIYTRAAVSGNTADRRPLITIPGTLGTRLVDSATGTVIWGGGSRGISADPDNPDEYQLIALPIPRGDEPLKTLRDSVVPAGLVGSLSAEVLGIPLDIDVYNGALQTLRAGGFSTNQNDEIIDQIADVEQPLSGNQVAGVPAPKVDDTSTAFNFDYDWRRDLIETAHRFGRFLAVRQRAIAAARGVRPEEIRFDLLAHSMGGMVSRYFLMYGFQEPDLDGSLPPITWAGARYFSRVVFVAPPNSGSVIALDNLINGKSLGPLQPFYPAAMLATHPSVYQLMPRPRHGRITRDGTSVQDLYDLDLWEKNGWGLAAPDAAEQLALMMPNEPNPNTRRKRALAYKERVLDRARLFHQMMDRWAPAPEWLELFLVVGGGFETPAMAEIDPLTGTYQITGVEEGDGVVLRSSALLDERQGGATGNGLQSPLRFKTTLFLPDEHVELTKNPVFGDNLLFWLLEAPRSGIPLAKPGQSDILSATAGENKQVQPDRINVTPKDQ